MKVRVQRHLCVGHALCAAVAPHVYVLDEEGFCASDGRFISAEHHDDARRGALQCPEQAIQLEDEQ